MKHVIDRNAQTLVPGLILYSSWGYNQTNIDFYIVVSVTAKMATIAEIEAPATDIMFGTKFPTLPVVLKGTPFRCKPRGANIKIASYASAYPWDGSAKEVSHTH